MSRDFSFLTDEELREMRAAWMDALRALSTGVRNYMLGSRMVTRYDMDDIVRVLQAIADEIQMRKQGGRARRRGGRILPRDG